MSALRARIQALTPQNTRLWGTMTTEQMLAHCSDQIRIALGELPCKDISSFFSRTFIKWLVLYVLPIPKGVKTVKELNFAKGGGTPPSPEWETEKNTLLAYLEKLAQSSENLDPHPAFGALSKTQWAIIAYAHCDYHLRQFSA